MSNGKVIIVHLIFGLTKKTLYKMSQYFPKPYKPFGGDINVRVDLSNYATKADIKNITHVDTSSFALKTNLATLKTEVDKLDIDKLAPVPVDLSKLSNVVKNGVIKKTAYNAKICEIEGKIPEIRNVATKTALASVENKIPDTSGLVKTDYNTKIADIEPKIQDTSNLATKTNLTTEINKIENEIPSISNLATKTALAAVENKIPSITNLIKKTDYNTKVTEIEKKLADDYIKTSKFNKLASDIFNARLAQANIITKTDFNAKLSSLNRKITKTKSDHLLVKNELNKLKTVDFGYFIGKSHFEEDVTQNYLVFQPLKKVF